jgi:hypothetical protein
MQQWRIESQGDVWIVDTPDGTASFILDKWSVGRLGAGLVDAVYGSLQPGEVGQIRCETFVFIPYCAVCPSRPGGQILRGGKTSKSTKSLIPSNHRETG